MSKGLFLLDLKMSFIWIIYKHLSNKYLRKIESRVNIKKSSLKKYTI